MVPIECWCLTLRSREPSYLLCVVTKDRGDTAVRRKYRSSNNTVAQDTYSYCNRIRKKQESWSKLDFLFCTKLMTRQILIFLQISPCLSYWSFSCFWCLVRSIQSVQQQQNSIPNALDSKKRRLNIQYIQQWLRFKREVGKTSISLLNPAFFTTNRVGYG